MTSVATALQQLQVFRQSYREKRGKIRANVTSRRVRVTIAAVGKQ